MKADIHYQKRAVRNMMGDVKKGIQELMSQNSQVREWYASNAQKSRITANLYAQRFYYYFNWVSKREGFKNVEELLEDHKGAKKGDNEYKHNDFLKSFITLEKGDKSKGYKEQIAAAVMSFYAFNRMALLPEKFNFKTVNDKVKEQKKQALKPMSIDDLRSMLTLMKMREKAVALILLQSGMGCEEFKEFNNCHCEPDYVKTKGHYCQSVNVIQQLERVNRGEQEPLIKIQFTQRKSNPNRYFTFIGKDAIQHLNSYLKFRIEQVRTSKVENENITPGWKAGQPIFLSNFLNAYSDKDFRKAIRTYKRQAGLSDRLFSPHGFRDIFKTECSHAGVDDKISEYWIGHSLDKYGYNVLDKLYPQDFEKEYRKVEPSLNIISTSMATAEELSRLKEKMSVSERETTQLRHKVDSREELIEQLLQNGKHKTEQIETLNQKIAELNKTAEVKMTATTIILKNLLERMVKLLPEDESLKELWETVKNS